MRHLEVRRIPVDDIVLKDLAEYVADAPFKKLRESEVCTDLQLLGLKCMHVTAALGIPRGRKLGAMRLRGYTKTRLLVADATDIILLQALGLDHDAPAIQGEVSSETTVVSLIYGTSVRVDESIDIVVPPGVTVDLLCISGLQPDDPGGWRVASSTAPEISTPPAE